MNFSRAYYWYFSPWVKSLKSNKICNESTVNVILHESIWGRKCHPIKTSIILKQMFINSCIQEHEIQYVRITCTFSILYSSSFDTNWFHIHQNQITIDLAIHEPFSHLKNFIRSTTCTRNVPPHYFFQFLRDSQTSSQAWSKRWG